ncbi:MAG: family 16 glycosylhydrolase [Lentimonas sp.]
MLSGKSNFEMTPIPTTPSGSAIHPSSLRKGIIIHLSWLLIFPFIASAEIPTNGLVLHLDSSVTESVGFNREGKIIHWADLSGNTNDVSAQVHHAPILIKKAMNDKDVVRFSGEEWLNIPKLSDTATGYSVFIVYQRLKEQSGKRSWQRIFSCADKTHDNDTKAPAFNLSAGDDSGPKEPQISYDLFQSNLHGPMTLGAYYGGYRSELHGDIAEVLVYDRSFIVFEPIEKIQHYLYKKWGIAPDSASDWTHRGPLPDNLPVRENGNFPLSDQDNTRNWQAFDALWDEFNGDALDDNKWWDHNPQWYGRAPSRYLARNATVADGKLQLTMSKDPTIPVEHLYRNHTEYKDYIAASVVGKEPINYGYFEIRAKPMASAASSAWWFTAHTYDKQEKKGQRLEIDVFEIGAKAPGKEYSYNMNLHSFKSAKESKHYSIGSTWIAGDKLMDRYWVFGLEWTPEEIIYYVDGHAVRRVKNDRWHGPQYMIFDTETMVDWLGAPKDDDLPSTFKVDYVRTWTNPETENDWEQRYELRRERGHSRITKYVRAMEQSHTDKTSKAE